MPSLTVSLVSSLKCVWGNRGRKYMPSSAPPKTQTNTTVPTTQAFISTSPHGFATAASQARGAEAGLLRQVGKRGAQRFAGNLHQSLEGMGQLHDQEDRRR